MNGIPLTEELKASLNQFYVYAYIRQRNSPIGNVGTPYYIGKGKDDRAWEYHRKTPVPKDISRIIIVGHNLTEEEAFSLEVKMIADYGRVDNNTGILRNRTDGGDGSSGLIHSDDAKRKMSKAKKGRIPWNKGKPHTDAAKLLMSLAKKGTILSDATKLLLSKAKKGKPHTDAAKLLMSKAREGKIFITDGINNKFIHPTDPIPSGWRKGRFSRRNTVASGSDIYAFLVGTS